MSKKNDLGQFHTPRPIARFMVNWVLGTNANNLLDPAVGQGVFLTAAAKHVNPPKMTAYEIDEETISALTQNCPFDFTLYQTDYLTAFCDKKFSAIICNPPYNKFQKVTNRHSYISLFEEKYDIRLSGYSNLCVYFLIKSINELEEGGRCCYIMPYEFLATGYGKAVKKYLLEKKLLKTIIKFNSTLKVFEDAITTSCILCLELSNNDFIEFVNVTDIGQLEVPFKENLIHRHALCDIDYNEKWLNYFKKTNSAFHSGRLIPLSSVAKVKRGIATGNNNYFTLSNTKIKERRLSQNVCVPCITKSQNVTKYIFTDKDFKELVERNRHAFLFDGTKAISDADFAYIDFGKTSNVGKTYLTSHRTPWYAIEEREAAPIWISVFSRGHFKIVRNEAGVKNLTTFHGIYFNKDVSNEFINIFFCYLLTPVAQTILQSNKREYGDGLNKFEPNDLNDASVLNLEILSQEDKKHILNLYKKLKESNHKTYINQLNDIFQKYLD